jgi:hypothetical protein
VVLTFSKSTGQHISKGPFSSVIFEGEQISDGNSGRVIGRHLPHGWMVDGEEFLRLDVEGSVSVRWEGHTPDPGTTGHFSCVNGVAYIDRRILAFVDRSRRTMGNTTVVLQSKMPERLHPSGSLNFS